MFWIYSAIYNCLQELQISVPCCIKFIYILCEEISVDLKLARYYRHHETLDHSYDTTDISADIFDRILYLTSFNLSTPCKGIFWLRPMTKETVLNTRVLVVSSKRINIIVIMWKLLCLSFLPSYWPKQSI